MSTTHKTAKLDGVEAWVVKNSSLLALGIVALAFAVGLACADCSYLNPDEAVHFDAARASTWAGAYERSLKIAHPPLFILVLHAMIRLGRTEIILRLPSLVGGTAALWLTFAWLRRSLGALPGLAGLGFMALSHMGISASTEARQYGLLLFFVSGSLYATERALTGRSVFWTIAQGFSLLGALLTHYTAVIVIVSISLYVLARALVERMPRRILLVFVADYVVLAIFLGWLYLKHIRGSNVGLGAPSNDYLRPYCYMPGYETLLGFVWRALTGTFSYAVESRLPVLSMEVFGAGIAALMTGRTEARRLMALLVGCPFAVGFAAAVAQVFPFVGSRHQAYLLPFLAAGIAASLAWLPREFAAFLLLIAGAFITPLWISCPAPDNDCRLWSKHDMSIAIEYISKTIPRRALLISDFESDRVLRYYLTRNDTNFDNRSPDRFEERFGEYRVAVSGEWSFRADEVLGQATIAARKHGVPPGEPVWVVSVGWPFPKNTSKLSTALNCNVKEFGQVSVIRIVNRDQAQVTPEQVTPEPTTRK